MHFGPDIGARQRLALPGQRPGFPRRNGVQYDLAKAARPGNYPARPGRTQHTETKRVLDFLPAATPYAKAN